MVHFDTLPDLKSGDFAYSTKTCSAKGRVEVLISASVLAPRVGVDCSGVPHPTSVLYKAYLNSELNSLVDKGKGLIHFSA